MGWLPQDLRHASRTLVKALGADRRRVVWLVMREVVILVVAGVGLGLPLAIAFSHVVRAQLFGVSQADPLTYVAAAMTLVTVALVAGYVPAAAASRVDRRRLSPSLSSNSSYQTLRPPSRSAWASGRTTASLSSLA